MNDLTEPIELPKINLNHPDNFINREIGLLDFQYRVLAEAQDESYRQSVLPESVEARVVVEAGVTGGWYKYAGTKGKIIGLDRFGESAPAGELFKMFGFTVDNVVATVEEIIG